MVSRMSAFLVSYPLLVRNPERCHLCLFLSDVTCDVQLCGWCRHRVKAVVTVLLLLLCSPQRTVCCVAFIINWLHRVARLTNSTLSSLETARRATPARRHIFLPPSQTFIFRAKKDKFYGVLPLLTSYWEMDSICKKENQITCHITGLDVWVYHTVQAILLCNRQLLLFLNYNSCSALQNQLVALLKE